jgi:hypothetical protein
VKEQARESRVLTANSDTTRQTNWFLKEKQLELQFHGGTPSYYSYVQNRADNFKEVCNCKLKGCKQWLIGQLCLILPNHCDEYGEGAEVLLKELDDEEGENTLVAVKVQSALYTSTQNT